MENFSRRTTAVIVVCFALFAISWNYVWQKVEEVSYPPVYCSFQFQNVTCTPIGKIS